MSCRQLSHAFWSDETCNIEHVLFPWVVSLAIKVSDFIFTRSELVAIPSDESNSWDRVASCKRAFRTNAQPVICDLFSQKTILYD